MFNPPFTGVTGFAWHPHIVSFNVVPEPQFACVNKQPVGAWQPHNAELNVVGAMQFACVKAQIGAGGALHEQVAVLSVVPEPQLAEVNWHPVGGKGALHEQVGKLNIVPCKQLLDVSGQAWATVECVIKLLTVPPVAWKELYVMLPSEFFVKSNVITLFLFPAIDALTNWLKSP